MQNLRIIKGNQASVNRVMEASQPCTMITDLVAIWRNPSIFLAGVDDDTMNRWR